MAHELDSATPAVTRRSARGTQFGYGVAIAINAGLLYTVRHVLEWGWPRFLTEQFTQLVPVVTLSLAVTIIANIMFLFYDAAWFKSLANAITAAIAFVVSLRTLQVFPFDFSTYDHDWSGVVRVLLLLAMAGAAVGCVVETIRFLTWPLRRQPHHV